jgi:hypothetical protein
MGINNEKGKSCEYYVELRILYVHQKVGAVQTIKIYPTTKNSCQVRYIQPLAGFQRLWPDMFGPQARHVRPLSLFLS